MLSLTFILLYHFDSYATGKHVITQRGKSIFPPIQIVPPPAPLFEHSQLNIWEVVSLFMGKMSRRLFPISL